MSIAGDIRGRVSEPRVRDHIDADALAECLRARRRGEKRAIWTSSDQAPGQSYVHTLSGATNGLLLYSDMA